MATLASFSGVLRPKNLATLSLLRPNLCNSNHQLGKWIESRKVVKHTIIWTLHLKTFQPPNWSNWYSFSFKTEGYVEFVWPFFRKNDSKVDLNASLLENNNYITFFTDAKKTKTSNGIEKYGPPIRAPRSYFPFRGNRITK